LSQQSLERVEQLLGIIHEKKASLPSTKPNELTLEQRMRQLSSSPSETKDMIGGGGAERLPKETKTPPYHPPTTIDARKSSSSATRIMSIPQTFPSSLTDGAPINVVADELFANTTLFLQSNDQPVQKARNGLPISPLLLAQQETLQQLNTAKQTFEMLKSMDNSSFDSSLHYLATIRKFDENIRMLSERKELLDQKALKASSMTILNLDPTEFAIQLMLIEFEYLKRICVKEEWLIYHHHHHYSCEKATEEEEKKKGREDQETDAPNVMGLITIAQHVYSWIQTEILVVADTKMRGAILSHVIQIIKACYMVKNFDMVDIMLRALQSSEIQRLQQTWKEVSKPTLIIWHEMVEIFSGGADHEMLQRTLYHQTTPPFMPSINHLLNELDTIQVSKVCDDDDDDNKDSQKYWNSSYLNDNVAILFNFVEYLQNHVMEDHHKPDLMLQHYILTRTPKLPDDLIAFSYAREPKKSHEKLLYDPKTFVHPSNRISEPFVTITPPLTTITTTTNRMTSLPSPSTHSATIPAKVLMSPSSSTLTATTRSSLGWTSDFENNGIIA
jgi:hypothetical protein